MFEFQKILVGIYILAQLSANIYLYSTETSHQSNTNTLNKSSISPIWPYFIVSFILVILFVIISRKDPGRIIIEKKSNINLDQDLTQKDGQADNNVNQENKQNKVTTQRAIFPSFNKQNIHIKDIQQRFCHICQIYQPYRVRHCHQCDSCISTFDHHCPWINNCIGEKNRHYYYTFLIIQLVQALLFSIKVLKLSLNSMIKQDRYNTGILSIAFILYVALALSLLIFHTYLMLKNLTTYQFLKRDYIGYMNLKIQSQNHQEDNKQKSKTNGEIISPFSNGKLRNIRQYWSVAMSKQRKIWQFRLSSNN